MFWNSLRSEMLKTKGSMASWLCVIGGFLVPAMYFIYLIKEHLSINVYPQDIWQTYFMKLWYHMAPMLLPMGVILSSTLIFQLETKNNSWKQLHATPQKFSTIFWVKNVQVILMTVKFFIFFNAGIVLSGLLSCLLFDHHLPKETLPMLYFVKWNLKFFLICLPIIAIQSLAALKFKNFIAPIGVGLAGLIGTMISFRWKYIYLSPYSYGILNFAIKKSAVNIYVCSMVYFCLIIPVSYFVYLYQKDKS
jgi:hypothetical protein